MPAWEGNFSCEVILDSTKKFQTKGKFRQSDDADGNEALVISAAQDFPACVMTPMLAFGWQNGNPLYDVVEQGVELGFSRTIEFPNFIENMDDNLQLIAEGKIKKDETGGIGVNMVITNPRGKINLLEISRLESVSSILQFHETTFEAANKQEILMAKERSIDVTGKVLFLTKTNTLIDALLCTQWTWSHDIKLARSAVNIYNDITSLNPVTVIRDLKCQVNSFGHITITGTAALRVNPEAEGEDGDDDVNSGVVPAGANKDTVVH